MIVDCHTHVWQSPEQLGQVATASAPRPTKFRGVRVAVDKPLQRSIVSTPSADVDYHYAQTAGVDKAIVLGFKSRYLRAEVPNRYVSDYVQRDPRKLIGFAGIDPMEGAALQEVRIAKDDLRLSGITISPANQDFHPSDTRAMKIYALAEELGMPILIHPGSPAEQAKMEYGRPYLLDEVARTFPKLRLIIAQLGYPWTEETIVLLGKHQNVFADVSGLLARPWPAYNALVSAYQYGVIDRLLFGSDFPYTGVTECIEGLYSLNQMVHGTNLPVVPREALRGIIERDTLALLGLS